MPAVVCFRRHEQVQQGRFSAAAAADKRICPACLKLGIYSVQHRLPRFICERDVFKPNSVFKPVERFTPLAGRAAFQRGRKFIHKPQRRFAAGKQSGKLRNGRNDKIHKVNKQNNCTGRHAAALHRKVHACNEHSELSENPRDRADHSDERFNAPSREFFMLKGFVALREQAKNLPLRPEVFNNGKPCETIAECGGEFSVPFGNPAFNGLQSAARQKGCYQRKHRQPCCNCRHEQ